MIVIFVREIAIQFQVAAIYPQVLFIYLQSSTLYAFEEINEWQHAVPPLVKNRRARLNNETHRPFTVWDDILIPGPVTDCDFCEWAEEMAIATGYIICPPLIWFGISLLGPRSIIESSVCSTLLIFFCSACVRDGIMNYVIGEVANYRLPIVFDWWRGFMVPCFWTRTGRCRPSWQIIIIAFLSSVRIAGKVAFARFYGYCRTRIAPRRWRRGGIWTRYETVVHWTGPYWCIC